MLFANDEQRRLAARRLQRGLEERGDEFFLRVDGFLKPQSPWYVGEGPFQAGDDFHPAWLNDDQFLLYSKLVTELNAYLYLDRERWALQAAKIEFTRLMNELDSPDAVDSTGMARPAFTKRDALMLSLASFLYDQSYFRFDTKDRHGPNQRIKNLRDRLAAFCRTIDLNALAPEDAIAYGSGLGLSTLFCISIYPFEWGREEEAASMLPDLYAASFLTQYGLKTLIQEDGRFACPMSQIETVLLPAIPWTQTMTTLGYPYAAGPGAFTRIAKALEAHRMPGTTESLTPQPGHALTTPWVPFTHTLFPALDPALYNKEDVNSATKQIAALKNPSAALAQMPTSLQQRDLNITHRGSRMTLRQQLELFSLPRPARETQDATQVKPAPIQRDAGWRIEDYPPMPGPWGTVYHLASRESKSPEFVDRWSEIGADSDNHPYTFFYTAPGGSSMSPLLKIDPVLMKYPDENLTIFSIQEPREKHLLAIQSATDTVVSSTLQVAHESFLLHEGGLQFRWFHDLYGATEAVESASGEIGACTAFDYSAPPLLTSLYSTWQQDSPAGRTICVRRHEGTVGSAYNIIAHIPKSASAPVIGTRNIIIAIPPKADIMLGDMNEWIQMDVKGDELSEEIYNMRDWQALRRLERRGTYKPQGFGLMQFLFSPNTLMKPHAAEGDLGEILELQLRTPVNPFFYITSLQQPGREKFELKYATLPMPGLRILEWHEGIEVMAVRQGETIDNPFIKSDADFVIATRDSAMKAVFYLVVNGSYARVKFTPQQRTPILLFNSKKEKITAAWAGRKVHVASPPKSNSVFYAPGVTSFECPDALIKFGRKKNQAVVLGMQ